MTVVIASSSGSWSCCFAPEHPGGISPSATAPGRLSPAGSTAGRRLASGSRSWRGYNNRQTLTPTWTGACTVSMGRSSERINMREEHDDRRIPSTQTKDWDAARAASARRSTSEQRAAQSRSLVMCAACRPARERRGDSRCAASPVAITIVRRPSWNGIGSTRDQGHGEQPPGPAASQEGADAIQDRAHIS